MTFDEYLKSERWQEKREAAIERAGNTCQLCMSPLFLNVHHRTYRNLGNEEPMDLTVLCRSCHKAFHGWKRKREEFRTWGSKQRQPTFELMCEVCAAEFMSTSPRTKTCSGDCKRQYQTEQTRLKRERTHWTKKMP